MLMKNKGKIVFSFGSLVLAFICAWVWFSKSQSQSHAPVSSVSSRNSMPWALSGNEVNAPGGAPLPETPPALARSLRGTDIDCPMELDAKGGLIPTVGVRRCFDYFFSSLGEKSEEQLSRDIGRHLLAALPSTAQPYALALLAKYINYRHADIPSALNAKDESPQALQSALDALKRLRLRYFTPLEAQAFFGEDEAYDQYHIAMLGVDRDEGLSQAQKESRRAALMTQLPPSLVKNMVAAQQYNVMQAKTEEIKARGGSEQELYAMRESIVGSQAADRLAKLDAETADWNQRLSKYLAMRAQIKAETADAKEQGQLINALRNQTFSLPEDRIRAQTYESMRDNGDNRIF